MFESLLISNGSYNILLTFEKFHKQNWKKTTKQKSFNKKYSNKTSIYKSNRNYSMKQKIYQEVATYLQIYRSVRRC